MKNSNITPASVWEEYQKDVSYKNSIDLYEKTKQHQNFFLGRQWEGLNAPDLEKPVLNFVKRVVNYLVSVLMVNDIAMNVKNAADEKLAQLMEKELERINENTKFKTKLRNVIKNTAVDGDGAIYVRYNPDTKEVESEIIHATDVVFGDKSCAEAEKQPYIIIVRHVHPDIFAQQYPNAQKERRYYYDSGWQESVTVLTRLYRKNGTVHFVQTTETQLLQDETDTGQKLYPLAFMNWEAVRGSYHGMGAVESIIPNQIAVNKLWAMALLYQKNNAFPRIFVDKTKLDKWDSRVGAVMGVVGNPNDAVATSFRAGDMSAQLMAIVDKTISYTKDFMGANDAALGNVSPNNTSAIVTLQKSSVAPLELQRLALYQFVEDYARIVYDIVKNFYGARMVQTDNGAEYADFSRIEDNAKLLVDIGQSEYWSESAQISTMDNLFAKGIINDALIYLENLPARALPNKSKIIRQIEEEKQRREQNAQAAYMQGALHAREMEWKGETEDETV